MNAAIADLKQNLPDDAKKIVAAIKANQALINSARADLVTANTAIAGVTTKANDTETRVAAIEMLDLGDRATALEGRASAAEESVVNLGTAAAGLGGQIVDVRAALAVDAAALQTLRSNLEAADALFAQTDVSLAAQITAAQGDLQQKHEAHAALLASLDSLATQLQTTVQTQTVELASVRAIGAEAVTSATAATGRAEQAIGSATAATEKAEQALDAIAEIVALLRGEAEAVDGSTFAS